MGVFLWPLGNFFHPNVHERHKNGRCANFGAPGALELMYSSTQIFVQFTDFN